jgi:hypothetical protein
MTDTIIHVGDVGTVIRLTVTEKDGTTPINVSTASVKTFYFRKPDGTKFNRPAEFNTDGADGKLKYTTVDGDIDVTGHCRFRHSWKLVLRSIIRQKFPLQCRAI